MGTGMEQRIKIDCHTHILPAMDDGAKDRETAVAMLHALKAQGVEAAVLTPHYYASHESPAMFLERREAALQTLTAVGEIPLRLTMGAEVHITRELADIPDIEKLRIGDSAYMLLEMPYLPLADWMTETLENMYYQHGCKPLLAHLPRYFAYYSEKDFDSLFCLQEVVVQVNAEDLQDRLTRKLVKSWIKRGVPMVFGSDCHGMGHRPPNWDTVAAHTSKLRHGTCPADEANAVAEEIGIM